MEGRAVVLHDPHNRSRVTRHAICMGACRLILDGVGMEAWLAGNPPQLAENIDAAIKLFPVSPRMNKPAYNAPDCIEPLAA